MKRANCSANDTERVGVVRRPPDQRAAYLLRRVQAVRAACAVSHGVTPWAASPAGLVAPVLREHVVEQVVDGDRARAAARRRRPPGPRPGCRSRGRRPPGRSSPPAAAGPSRRRRRAADERRRRLAQQPLDVRAARATCRWGSPAAAGRRRPCAARDTGQVGVADVGERVGHGRVRTEDHRLRRHHRRRRSPRRTTSGGGRPRPPRAPSAPAGPRAVSGGRSAIRSAASSADISSRMSAARSESRWLEDLDLVLLRELLEHVGQPLVVERRDHGGPSLLRQVVDHVGRVGGPHLVQRGDQVGRALVGLAAGQALDVAPLDDVGLPAPAEGPSRAPARRPGRAPSRGCGPAPCRRRRRCRRRRSR